MEQRHGSGASRRRGRRKAVQTALCAFGLAALFAWSAYGRAAVKRVLLRNGGGAGMPRRTVAAAAATSAARRISSPFQQPLDTTVTYGRRPGPGEAARGTACGGCAERFVAFDGWLGGFNNVRHSLEMVVAYAVLTNRTLVLPPPVYVLFVHDSQVNDPRTYTDLGEFFDLGALRQWVRCVPFDRSPLASLRRRSDGVFTDAAARRAGADAIVDFRKLCPQNKGALHPERCVLRFPGSGAAPAGADDELRAFAYGRDVVDDPGAGARVVWFPRNLLGNFYMIFYTPDAALRRRVARTVKHGVRYRAATFAAAAAIAAHLGPSFHAAHIRRGDFSQTRPETMLDPRRLVERLEPFVPAGRTLYVASNERDATYFDALGERNRVVRFGDVSHLVPEELRGRPEQVALIETVVCAHAEAFVGSALSTYSSHVYRMRGYWGRANLDYVTLTEGCVPVDRGARWSWAHGPGGCVWCRDYPEGWNTGEDGLRKETGEETSCARRRAAASPPPSSPPPLPPPEDLPADETAVVFYSGAACDGGPVAFDRARPADGAARRVDLTASQCEQVKSMRVLGPGVVDLYSDWNLRAAYHSSAYPGDGCVRLWDSPSVQGYRIVADPPGSRRQLPAGRPTLSVEQWARERWAPSSSAAAAARRRRPPGVVTYAVVSSMESSEYMGYQSVTSYYAFLTSQQGAGARWVRLLTAREPDDLADLGLPTFTARRHPYSRRYSPLNKPDVIAKWFASADAPDDDVVVVNDPDAWLLGDLSPWAAQVSPGHAVGQAAYYHGGPIERTVLRELWRELCVANCTNDVQAVGVPYVLARDDLRRIAPLWRDYTLAIKIRMEAGEPGRDDFRSRFGAWREGAGSGDSGIDWVAEMFGYNLAAAHCGVRHDVVVGMQLRDVDLAPGSGDPVRPFLHVGRAWFPRDYEPAGRWAQHDAAAKQFSHRGIQVWCKCNVTASTVVPWPVPDGADFQSRHTLRLLREAREAFGEVPFNVADRAGGADLNGRYMQSKP